MEIYQYWTIAGFIFLFLELITLRTLPLVLAGSALFSAVIAFKYPNAYYIQFLTCFVFAPLIFFAVKPYIKNKIHKFNKRKQK